jgi:DNA-binding GntR family transcriptional regulator
MDRPLYRALAERIESRIAAGHYAVGSQLPTEPEFEREFGVSRITIRQALRLLKRRGLLASRSGLGTVVRSAGTEEQTITAVAAPVAVARELALAARTPMLKAMRIYRLAGSRWNWLCPTTMAASSNMS